MTTTYSDDHPGTSLDHLRAAVAHLTRALGLAFGEGVDKEARVAVRAARDLMHEAIEALTRQARERRRQSARSAERGGAMTSLADRLRALGACAPAIKWVAAQPIQRPEALWAACRDGSWMLWLLERAGIDCSELGFVCAERARQSALRALPPSPERDALAACAPIVDRETAQAAARALAALTAGRAASPVARAAARAVRAAWAAEAAEWAARAAEWAARAEAAGAAAKAEFAAIAELVRERWPVPPREVIEMLGGEG